MAVHSYTVTFCWISGIQYLVLVTQQNCPFVAFLVHEVKCPQLQQVNKMWWCDRTSVAEEDDDKDDDENAEDDVEEEDDDDKDDDQEDDDDDDDDDDDGDSVDSDKQSDTDVEPAVKRRRMVFNFVI